MNIGEKIKELRKKNNLTQEKLADFLNVSCQAVSKWENGIACPDLSLIAPLTRLLHISSDELLGLDKKTDDSLRAEFDAAYNEYKSSRDIGRELHEKAYHTASDAVREYPREFRYLEWLASSEYDLAVDEDAEHDGSLEFFDEMIDNSIRHYEIIIENCTDQKIRNRAIWGMILALSFTGRKDEARWYAEIVYPEKQEKTRDDAIELCLEGDELLIYRQKTVDDSLSNILLSLDKLENFTYVTKSNTAKTREEKVTVLRSAIKEYLSAD